MDLRFTPRGDRVPRRGARLLPHHAPDCIRDKLVDGGITPRRTTRRLDAHPEREGLGGAALAGRMGRHRLDPGPAVHLPATRCSSAPAPQPLAVRRQHGRAGDLRLRLARSRSSASCRASPISTTGGARASPSRAPAPTSPRCKTTRAARRRPLRRQRPEDLDDAGAVRRLDLLPGAHRPGRRRSRRASRSC